MWTCIALDCTKFHVNFPHRGLIVGFLGDVMLPCGTQLHLAGSWMVSYIDSASLPHAEGTGELGIHGVRGKLYRQFCLA